MSDEPTTNPPIPPLAEIGRAVAPIIYFDAAPNFGFNNGICSIALEAFTYVNVGGKLEPKEESWCISERLRWGWRASGAQYRG
jgi:hypothetical protein